MDSSNYHHRTRALILFILIFLLIFLLFYELRDFIPGMLAALTTYILTRKLYEKVCRKFPLRKGFLAMLFMLAFLMIITLLTYWMISWAAPKLQQLFSHKNQILDGVQLIISRMEKRTGITILNGNHLENLQKKIAQLIPQALNSLAMFLANILMMFFVYYYLLSNGLKIEKTLADNIPLKKSSVNLLAEETINMVRANAIGIPIISVIQGLFAALGYWIFNISDWGLWGFCTGLFAFFPFVGTMVIWVPLVVFLYSNGMNGAAVGLAVYSFVVTGNVDYLARITLMKKIGDVHPLITVFGVIAGLSLFGFIGFIFGPLLVSYCWVLMRIFHHEFILRDGGEPIRPE